MVVCLLTTEVDAKKKKKKKTKKNKKIIVDNFNRKPKTTTTTTTTTQETPTELPIPESPELPTDQEKQLYVKLSIHSSIKIKPNREKECLLSHCG